MSLSIHLLINTLGCFCLLAIVNNAAVDRGVQIAFQDPAFSSFGCIPRSEIRSNDNSVFNLLMNTLNRAQGFQFLPLSILVFCFFDSSHSDGHGVVVWF